MRKALLSFILLLSCLKIYSQSAIITTALTQKLSNLHSSELVKVNIVFTEQVHHGLLNTKFKEQNTPMSIRAKTVISKSMQLAKNTQLPIIQILQNNSSKVKSYKQFWIINMMTIKATKDIVEQLSYHPNIDYIEDFDHFKSKPIDITKSKSTANKSVGGIEPGLAAINAPALWAMGYSGKGRRYYSIDTGVWPQHPALSDNWLGNYQPIDQAWYGIDSPTPVDKNGTHGTHTAGTVLGLDPLTSDTIGVAFNAYFMVSDPIVTTASAIKPLPEYIDVFQFALNPDGDTTTTDDIPDAINNSWGISGESQDTSICAGYVTQMFDAIEAAGIANIFSAGNSGPGDTTIGKPQYVSTGLVNTFTVGAIDGTLPAFPITSFSSHGPTACLLTGSLKIKPEVVAPGLNVRSSVGMNNYASFNGTSMAGPHATGAVLLLKEAYPNVSGEEILLALYNTAIDLGVAGEDNTYGNGMIDVLAAFNELALTNTPTTPSQFSYDIYVQKIISPSNKIQCSQTVTPQLIIENKGDSTINNAVITYRLNNEPTNIFNWNGTLNSGDMTTVTLPTISALGFGNYELIINVTIDTTKIECDYINNQRVYRFNIRNTVGALPYSENFENMRIDSSEWLVFNPDGETTWDTTETAGLPNSLHSATMMLYNYVGSSQLDELVSEKISLPNQDSLFLRFELSYQRFIVFDDTLSVYLSTDCGLSYDQIYKKGGVVLETNDTTTSNFIPKFPNHWRTEYVDITSYASNDIILKFETYNRSGNNVFIDNIWVYEGAEPVSIKENRLEVFSIYPNPTTNNIRIDIGNNDLKNATIEFFDLLGKSIKLKKINQKITSIDLSNLINGIYIVRFSNENGSYTNKLIKQ